LQALGFVILDINGKALLRPATPEYLFSAVKLDDSGVPGFVRGATVTLACDVDNPLIGARGASRVFGPQKGATPEMVVELDRVLGHFGRVLDDYTRPNRRGRGLIARTPGAGAAGGLGAGLMAAFPKCRIRQGIDIVLDACGFSESLIGADLVITGEGRVDSQTLGGKAITGVLRRAKAAKVPAVIIAGSADPDTVSQLIVSGVSAVIELSELAGSSEAAILDAARYARDAAGTAARGIQS
jgi:glycerate kinase